MRLLLKRGADPLFVHQSEYLVGESYNRRSERTNALMAATGMGGGGNPWVQPAAQEREALTLEAVKLAMESGVDVNAVNSDGRTTLDAAKGQGYTSVVKLLIEKGR